MGTNYFLIGSNREESDERNRLHIGKSSAGWTFGLRAYIGLENLDQWKNLFETSGSFIEDEYGREIKKEDLLERITKRSGSRSHKTDEERLAWLMLNYAVEGPNGLARRANKGIPSYFAGRIDYPEDLNETYDICWYDFR